MENQPKKSGGFGAIIVVLVIVVVLILMSTTIIETGYTGVKTSFGQVSDEVIPPGFVWHAPFVDEIEEVNNKQQDAVFPDAIMGETSERNSVVFTDITVTYTINPEKSAWIVAHVSNYKNDLISAGLVSSAVKTAAKQLSPTDVTNRALLEEKVREALQISVDQKYGDETIYINKVIVSNAEFEASYNEVILNKQKAQMQYEQQQIENQKSIEEAEAKAKVKVTEAEAEAQAKLIEADAEAEANRKIAASLTQEILQNRFYEEWDGKMPSVMSGNDQGTLIEVPIP